MPRKTNRKPARRTTALKAALATLRNAKAEVADLYEHDLGDSADMTRLLDNLVPYAEEVARSEGHGDFLLVLERELDL